MVKSEDIEVNEMNPMDNAWLLLKQKSYRPKAHLRQAGADLSDRHKKERDRLYMQQFADGFGPQAPTEEEQAQQKNNLRERQKIEQSVLSSQRYPYGSMRYRDGPSPLEQRRLQRGEDDLKQMQMQRYE
tara:strand:- start:465 stop:851 length:387 start_codon:yes stop_codon:yes gene_type:complete